MPSSVKVKPLSSYCVAVAGSVAILAPSRVIVISPEASPRRTQLSATRLLSMDVRTDVRRTEAAPDRVEPARSFLSAAGKAPR